jgi:putative acetyltransferase
MIGAVIIAVDSPSRDDVRTLLDEHLTDMYATSPPDSVHALDPSALLAPSITFLTAREPDGTLLGCGALVGSAHQTGGHGELKSMRTARSARGRGVATAILVRLLDLATARGYTRVHLETGTQEYFAPARRLYARHGFVGCGPFAGYVENRHSAFMRLALPAGAGPQIAASAP